MELYILEEDIIRNIQQNFQKHYPHLKLQFYKNPHGKGEPSPRQESLSPLLPIEEVTMFHTSGRINIDPVRTVAEVEHDFYRLMGLCVQIFRQAGDLWLETTGTDCQTLQQQEDKGKESMNTAPDEPEEYDLSDRD